MKSILLLSIVLLSNNTHAQDTISSFKLPAGLYQHFLRIGNDSIFRIEYESRKIESERSYSLIDSIQSYKRYYENGQTMLIGKLVKSNLHDTVSYFNEEGKLAAKFLYSSGHILDTLYISKKIKFLVGKADYYSVVHGGMVREDGQSNTRGGHGIYMFTEFYTVKLQKVETQEKYKSFRTDFNGNYFVVLSTGDFGIFPTYFDIDKVTNNMSSPNQGGNGGHMWSWNISSPIHFGSSTSFQVQNIHYESVGYAP